MRFFDALSVWTQTPVARRTVEVNTKTGFSLAATSRGTVKSIQRGTIAITAGNTTGTATLSPAVDTANCELRVLGSTPDTNDPRNLAYAVLTNTTTVTATRGVSTNGTVLAFEITEYYS